MYVCLSVCLSACLLVCLPACLPSCLSVCLHVCICIYIYKYIFVPASVIATGNRNLFEHPFSLKMMFKFSGLLNPQEMVRFNPCSIKFIYTVHRWCSNSLKLQLHFSVDAVYIPTLYIYIHMNMRWKRYFNTFQHYILPFNSFLSLISFQKKTSNKNLRPSPAPSAARTTTPGPLRWVSG